uniref:Birch protein n=1 Tax=Betula platyphylla TaxID=78630 RepID=A0A9E9NQI3_BETPL|nr:birch protein [Betula platyphylla]
MAGSEGFKNEDCKLNEEALIDDHIVEQGTEEEDERDALHRRLLISLVNWHSCEEEKVDDEDENGNEVCLAETERLKKEEILEEREIQNEMDIVEKFAEDPSMSNQITRELKNGKEC